MDHQILVELQSIISNIQSSFRTESEQSTSARFAALCQAPGSWRIFLQILPDPTTHNDTVFFFLSIGLNRVLWTQWQAFSIEERDLFASQVMALITTRSHSLQPFARLKLEQVLAGICANAGDFSPVTQLLVSPDSSDASSISKAMVGLSALKTALDEALGDDPRLMGTQKTAVTQAANNIILPATRHACTTLTLALTTLTSTPSLDPGLVEAYSQLVQVSLGLLQTIVLRVSVGQHLSQDVLDLLFSIAQLSTQQAEFSSSSIQAIEVLSELMGKKYLPPAPSALKPGNSPSDQSADMLVALVSKAIYLMQSAGRQGLIERSPVILPLLEFLVVFSENHMGRCLVQAPQRVTSFVQELTTLACATAKPEVLLKVASVWDAILGLSDEMKAYVLQTLQEPLLLSLASHLVHCCMLQRNTELVEVYADDILEEMSLDPFCDPHIREVVSHCLQQSVTISSSGRIEDVSASEGSALLLASMRLLAELSGSSAVTAMLGQTVPGLLSDCLATMSSTRPLLTADNTPALDICFLVRILPICTPCDMLISQLVGLQTRLIDAKCLTRGKEYKCLLIAIAQVLGQALQRVSTVPQSSENTAVVQTLPAIVKIVCAIAADVASSQGDAASALSDVLSAALVVLLQSLVNTRDAIHAIISSPDNAQSEFSAVVTTPLLQWVELPDWPTGPRLSREAHSLLICCVDQLVSGSIATHYGSQLSEIASRGPALLRDPVQASHVIKLVTAIDALVTHHSIAKALYRQLLISTLEPLKEALPSLCDNCFQCLAEAVSAGGDVRALLRCSFVLVCLASGLLRCLGKGSFGSTARKVFSTCVAFTDGPPDSSPGKRVIEEATGMGIELWRQMLILLQVIAESSSAISQSVPEQAASSRLLLESAASTLSSERVRTDLLYDVLKSGATSINCYWSARMPGGRRAEVAPSIEAIVLLLVSLVTASLAIEVSPENALMAIDGMTLLGSTHGIFSEPFFLQSCWCPLVDSIVRSLVMRTQTLHAEPLEGLLRLLQTAPSPMKIVESGSAALAHGANSYLAQSIVMVASAAGCDHCGPEILNKLSAPTPDISWALQYASSEVAKRAILH